MVKHKNYYYIIALATAVKLDTYDVKNTAGKARRYQSAYLTGVLKSNVGLSN